MSTNRILATHVIILYILPPFAGEQQYRGWLIICTMLCVLPTSTSPDTRDSSMAARKIERRQKYFYAFLAYLNQQTKPFDFASLEDQQRNWFRSQWCRQLLDCSVCTSDSASRCNTRADLNTCRMGPCLSVSHQPCSFLRDPVLG